jgi:hypothetical protein
LDDAGICFVQGLVQAGFSVIQSFIEGLWCLKPLSIIGHVRFVGGGNRGFSRKTKRS